MLVPVHAHARRHPTLALVVASLAQVAAGCGSGPPPAPPDGSLPVLPGCGAPQEIRDGESVVIDRGVAGGQVPVQCPYDGTYDGFASAPAQAFRYEVSGSGSRAVTITTANDQTAVATDTVIAVYDGDCDASRVALSCFDDTCSQGRYERRANGTVLARGGQVLTFLVGYFSTSSEGDITVEVSSRENRPPDITSAEALFLDDRVLVWAAATDRDGDTDVTALEIAFVGELGELIFVDGLATQRVDAIRVGTGVETTVSVVDLPAEVRGLLVRAVDAAGVTSASSVTATRVDGSLVGITDACDGPRGPAICLGELECASSGPAAGTCQTSAVVTAACAAPTVVELTPGMGETRVGHSSVRIEPGSGVLRYPFEQCPEGDLASYPPRTQGREQILSFTVPSGRWDVLARSSGPAELDTILYFRTACGDPESTIGCSDDVDAGALDYYSALEVHDVVAPAAGRNVAVIAELWDGPTGTVADTFDVDVTLRPVRTSGQSCDSAFELDRCEGTPCRGGTCP